MLDPELVKIYVQEYQREHAKRAVESRKQTARLQRTVQDAAAKIDRLVAAIAAGAGEFPEVRQAIADARAERATAEEQLAEVEALPVVALHPTIVDDYRRQVAELHTALAEPNARAAAIPVIRALIDRIVLNPNALGRGVSIEVEGRLNAIVALATGEEPREPTLTLERVKGIEPSS